MQQQWPRSATPNCHSKPFALSRSSSSTHIITHPALRLAPRPFTTPPLLSKKQTNKNNKNKNWQIAVNKGCRTKKRPEIRFFYRVLPKGHYFTPRNENEESSMKVKGALRAHFRDVRGNSGPRDPSHWSPALNARALTHIIGHRVENGPRPRAPERTRLARCQRRVSFASLPRTSERSTCGHRNAKRRRRAARSFLFRLSPARAHRDTKRRAPDRYSGTLVLRFGVLVAVHES